MFPDHVTILGHQRENRENGHSDERAEGDVHTGQFSVLLIPLFSLLNYSLLQCATVSEGVNRVIENNASDTLSLTDLKGHFSLRRSRKSQSKRSRSPNRHHRHEMHQRPR